MASGAEILSYQASADRGYGAEGTPFISGSPDALNDFNNTMKSVNQQNYQFNAMQYQQKIADRDNTMNLMANQNIDIDVLDKDRPVLEKQLNDIQNIWLEHPDIKSNPEAYNNLQKAISKFKEMKVSAGTRSVEIKKMKQEYAANPDAEFRQSIGEHIKTQEDAGINHLPDPYQQVQDFDETIFAKPAATVVKGESYEKNGLWYSPTHTKTDVKDFYNYYTPSNWIEGANKNIPNKIGAFYQHAIVNEDFMSDNNLNLINSKLDAINKEQNLDGTPLFLQPIAKKNDDGTWQITKDPAQLAMDVSLLKNYQNSTSLAPDKDAQKNSLTKAQEDLQKEKKNTEKATQVYKHAQAGAQGALASKYAAQAKKELALGRNVDAKTAGIKSKGADVVDQMVETFHRAHNASDFGPLNRVVPERIMPDIIKAAGIDNNYEVAKIPTSDLGAIKMLSRANYGVDGKYHGSVEPSTILVARNKGGSINQTLLIGLNKDGKVMKVVNPNNAAGEIIKYDNGYNHNQKTVELETAADAVTKEAQGSDAAGTDLGAIIRNHGVIPTNPKHAARSASAPAQQPAGVDRKQAISSDQGEGKTVSVDNAQIRQVDKKNKVYEVNVGGTWKRIIKVVNKKTIHY